MPDRSRSIADLHHLVTELRLLEARAGRPAVRVSVGLPRTADLARAREALRRQLRGAAVDVDLVPIAEGRPRLLTVDFSLHQALG